MTRVHNISSLLLLLLLMASCVQPDLEPRFTPAWEPVDTSAGDWLETRKVLLVADCQFHNLYSKALPERDLSTKEVVPTAIRAPQLDLFSEDVLKWILKNGSPDSEVILHLGDALDLACENEFYQFLNVMKEASRPWFMAPGNHDAFYFGNFEPKREDLWENACHGGGKPRRASGSEVGVSRSKSGDGWRLVHPRGVRDRAEDLEEVHAMIEAGDAPLNTVDRDLGY